MAFKAVVLCVSALLVQGITSRCISAPARCGCGSKNVISIGGCSSGISEVETISVAAPAIRYGSVGCSGSIASAPSALVVSGPALASSGGAFITTSVGPVAPSGIRVDNNNELYGELLVSGALPYLTAVAFEGSFANSGGASVAYGCGDGEIAITEVLGGNNAVLSGPSYGNSIVAGPSYGSTVVAGPSCGGAILPAPSCGCNTLPPSKCGCIY